MHKVEKTWGWEHWFANNEKYCGKIIFVRHNEWSSKGNYHYHKIKDETFFVVEGGLQLDYFDGNISKSVVLGRYESIRLAPGIKHRFTAVTEEGCKFIEASTTHMEEDSYRCHLNYKGWWVEDTIVGASLIVK
jgi:mannose-6-phosphate isomerase-like protein (cupin superfamily)